MFDAIYLLIVAIIIGAVFIPQLLKGGGHSHLLCVCLHGDWDE